jgi:transglutaminase-like putative cysteine protease
MLALQKMNKQRFLLFLLYLLSFTSYAQHQEGLADTLLQKGLRMSSYDKDTGAEAVVLSNIGTATIINNDNEMLLYLTKSKSIKILGQRGISYGTIYIPLQKREKITHLEAFTYNMEDNRVVRTVLDTKTIFDEKRTDNITVKRFALPDVKVGSVIYFSYTIASPHFEFFDWNFQEKLPVIYSEFNVSIPPFCDYEEIRQGMDSGSYKQKCQQSSDRRRVGSIEYSNIVYSYIYHDISAFKDEEFLTTAEDYLIKIRFQLRTLHNANNTSSQIFLSTWNELIDKLFDMELFGGYLNSQRSAIADIVKQLGTNGKSDAEKVKTFVNYIKTSYRWNSHFGIFSDKSMKDFLVEKSGNSADINLLLVALCKAGGIDAKPVLISTRDHGKIKANYPFIGFFNNVICYIKTDSLSLLLDGTEPLLSYYIIPSTCLNDYGLVMQSTPIQWVKLNPQITSSIRKIMTLHFSPNNDTMNIEFGLKTTGYQGFIYRKIWNSSYEMLRSILSHGRKIIDSIKVQDADQPEKPFTIGLSTVTRMTKIRIDSGTIDGKSHITFPPFLDETIHTNPLKEEDRKYPIDMTYPCSYEYQSTIIIPDGYKLSEKPDDLSYFMVDSQATFIFKTQQISSNLIQVFSSYSFNTAIFQPSEYKDLKKFYDVILKKFKEPIELIKG